MSTPDHAKLAEIALDLIKDLQGAGFGPCPQKEYHLNSPAYECEICAGADDDDREVNGSDLVDLMAAYFKDLQKAAGTAGDPL